MIGLYREEEIVNADRDQPDVSFLAKSRTVAIAVGGLIWPDFDTIEGYPFFRGPGWEEQADEFEAFIRRQLKHHRWTKRSFAEVKQIFASLSETDLSLCFNSYYVESDWSGDVMNSLACMLQKSWTAAIDQQYGRGRYAVSLIQAADKSPEGPYLRIEETE